MTVVCLLPTSTGSSSQRLARDGGRSVACPRTMAPGRVINGRIQRVLAFRERCRSFLLCSRSHWSDPDPERTEQTVPRALGRAISRNERASPNAHLSLALGYPRTTLPGISAASMAGIPSWCPQPPEWLRSPGVFDCGGWGRWQSLRAPTAWGAPSGHHAAIRRESGGPDGCPETGNSGGRKLPPERRYAIRHHQPTGNRYRSWAPGSWRDFRPCTAWVGPAHNGGTGPVPRWKGVGGAQNGGGDGAGGARMRVVHEHTDHEPKEHRLEFDDHHDLVDYDH